MPVHKEASVPRHGKSMIARALATLVIALMAAAPIGPAQADSPASGVLTATSACPALSSIRKGSNPGNVALTPQQTYQVVSANRTPATHYLVVVPGAEPARRWVAVDCGALAASGAPPVQRPAASAGRPNQPGADAPTHYVLSVSWEPGFCAGHHDKPECAAETSAGFDASHFTLHGLWPDPREYCGVSGQDIAADKSDDWSALPAVDLSPAARAHLDQDMPGTRSLLERHEWIKHGTCSGAAADAYFGRELDFLAAINASPVRALFAGSVGRNLSLDAIRDAFDQAFGTGAGQRIRLSCTRGGGARRITELTIGLDGDVMGATVLSTLIQAASPTGGGCDSGLVSAVE
jgi:ribonuclease T2